MEFRCESKKATTVGIVDSGADGTLLPMTLAADLGLDPSVGLAKTPHGSGGAAGTCFDTWTAGQAITGQVLANTGATGHQPWGPTINFAPVFAENAVALFGRHDFFAHFTVTFKDDPTYGTVFHLDY